LLKTIINFILEYVALKNQEFFKEKSETMRCFQLDEIITFISFKIPKITLL